MKGVIKVSNPGNTMPTTKKAVLFYNKQPLSFSDYAMYHIGADYIALYEKADNACVLCRILDEKEYPLFKQAKHRLVILKQNGTLSEVHIVIIKRDLHNLAKQFSHVKQIHGFYADKKTNKIYFDLILDFECKDVENQKNNIIKALEEKYPQYKFYILLDADISD